MNLIVKFSCNETIYEHVFTLWMSFPIFLFLCSDLMVHLNFAVLLNKCSEQREAAHQLSLFKKQLENSQSFVDPEVSWFCLFLGKEKERKGLYLFSLSIYYNWCYICYIY